MRKYLEQIKNFIGFNFIVWILVSCGGEPAKNLPGVKEIDKTTDHESPKLISMSPVDGLVNVMVGLPSSFIFNESIDPSSVTVDSDGNCAGSLQLSSDNFKSCIPLKEPSFQNQDQRLELFPVSPLESATTYFWRLTAGITDPSGNAIQFFEMQHGFTTASVGVDLLSEQLAAEVELSLRRTSKSILSNQQISDLVAEAVEGLKQQNQYYGNSKDLAKMSSTMVEALLTRVGAIDLATQDRITITQNIAQALVESTANKGLEDSAKYLSTTLSAGIGALDSAKLGGTNLPSASASLLGGITLGAEAAGITLSEMNSILPSLLRVALTTVLDQILSSSTASVVSRSKAGSTAITSANLVLVNQAIELFGTHSIHAVSSWGTWNSSSSQWSGIVGSVTSGLVQSLSIVEEANTTEAYGLIGSSVKGVTEGLGFVMNSSVSTINSVFSSLGENAYSAGSTLQFNSIGLSSVEIAKSIQVSSQQGLGSLQIASTTDSSSLIQQVSAGVLSSAVQTGDNIYALHSALGTDGTNPVASDLVAPNISELSEIGVTNNPTPTLTITTNEVSTFAESCSGTNVNIGIGTTTLKLLTLADGSYDNCRVTLTDRVGNERTQNLAKFVIDTIVPEIVEFQINGNAVTSNSSLLPLNWSATDSLSGVAAFYVSQTANSPDDEDAGWQNYTPQTTYQVSNPSVGPQSLYLWVRDAAGNQSEYVTSSITLYDNLGPSILSFQLEQGVAFTNKSTVNLSISTSDEFSGITAYLAKEANTTPLFNSTAWLAYSSPVYTFDNVSDGPKQVFLWLQDGEGNVSPVATDNITLDTVDPSLDNFSLAMGASQTNTRTVSLDIGASDSLSGVGYVYSSEDSTTPTASGSGWKNYQGAAHTFDNVSLGSKKVYVWVKDLAGNIDGSVNDTIELVDNTSPAITKFVLAASADFVTSDIVQLELGGQDDLTGVSHYLAKEDSATPAANDTNWTQFASTSIYKFDNDNDGLKTVYVWLKDAANNLSAPESQSVTLDKTAPLITKFLINDNQSTSSEANVTLTLSTDDDFGIAAYFLSESSQNPSTSDSNWVTLATTPSDFTDNLTFKLSEDFGLKTVYVWVMDPAGNISSASDEINFSEGLEAVDLNTALGGLTNNSVNIPNLLSTSATLNADNFSAVPFTYDNGTGLADLAGFAAASTNTSGISDAESAQSKLLSEMQSNGLQPSLISTESVATTLPEWFQSSPMMRSNAATATSITTVSSSFIVSTQSTNYSALGLSQQLINFTSNTSLVSNLTNTGTLGSEFRVNLTIVSTASGSSVSVTYLMTTVLEVNYSTYKGVVETTTSVANIVTSGVSQEQSKSDDFIAQQSAGSQKADFLLVIDNSGSMTEEQAIVVQNAELFFEKLLAAGLDFQVGMVATDRATLYEANGKKFFGANDQTDYESAVASVGIGGSGTESGIFWGEQALFDNGTVAQAGFPRKGATLSVLFISDEPDQYTSYTGNYMTPGTSFDFNDNLFLNNNYVAYAMVAIDPVTNSPGAANGTGVNCNSPSTGYAGGTIDYSKLVGLTGGIYGTICQEDYSAVLDKMIDQSASSGSPYILSEVPIPASISVRVNGQNIPLLDSSNSGYLFQKSSNSIVFYGKSIPKQGDAIQVDYKYVPDTTAPQLKSVSPEDGLQDAESDTNIVLLFTEDLSDSSVNTSNIKLIDNSTTQEIPGQLSLYGDRVVFNPTDNLTDNTTYLIQVTGVKDTSGNSLVGSLVSSFKTKIPDYTPPQILTISPTDGAIDISPDTRIEITFSEEINSADYSSIQLLDNNSGLQIYSQYQTIGDQAVLTPIDNLTDNTTYLIVINGVTDLAGNPLSNPSSTSFTTLNPDRTPPTLTSTFPTDGEINVALDTIIMLTFSEVLESTSLNTTNIQLLDNNTSLQVPAQLTPIKNQAILKPTDNLTDNTTYILRIEGVTDLAGNLLNGPITTSFHTRN